MRAAVVGLGKLGGPLAAVLADAGHEVVGVDLNDRAVAMLNDGVAPVEETGFQDLLNRCGTRLRATNVIGEAVAVSEITFVIVPTPTGRDGTFSLDLLLPAVAEIGSSLRDASAYHVVVITSTVMPGATGGPIAQALEEASGRTIGEGLGLCYSPEFIALGSVIRDMTNPDLVLIGESDARAGDALLAAISPAVKSNPAIRRMNYVNAELAKIAVNTFVTTKISFANMLGEICEQLHGADVDVVTAAMGLDSRIGTKYLRGATNYGGPCFPRDNVAFSRLAASVGTSADIAVATDRINRRQVQRLAELVRQVSESSHDRIAVLGLSYKPDTPVTDESTGLGLARRLHGEGFSVAVFDPVVGGAASQLLPSDIEISPSVDSCVAGAGVIVLATASREFKRLPEILDAKSGRRPVVIDCWRLLDPEQGGASARLLYLGKARTTESRASTVNSQLTSKGGAA